MYMYLQKGNKDNIFLNIGYAFLEVKNNAVTPILKINPFADYKAFNQRYITALEAGMITLNTYNTIQELQSNEIVYHELESISIEKSTIESLIQKHSITGIDNTTSISIISDLNTQGYNIIKKI